MITLIIVFSRSLFSKKSQIFVIILTTAILIVAIVAYVRADTMEGPPQKPDELQELAELDDGVLIHDAKDDSLTIMDEHTDVEADGGGGEGGAGRPLLRH